MAPRAFSFFVVIQQERTYSNEEQRETLKSFFKEGMTRVGSPLIPRAASATGLDTSVIENWIGNYKRSEPRPSKAKVHIRELSPYNLFSRDILKNKGTMKDMGRWSTLGKEDKDKYTSSSATTSCTRVEVNVLLRKVQDLFNQKYRKHMFKHFLKEARGTGRLPYQSLVNQGMTIKVAVLPNSLTFKKPSYYGRNHLEAILQAAEEISFEISK
ncbi:uncharacterized protein LOC113660589 [Tachysurus ichikawai]